MSITQRDPEIPSLVSPSAEVLECPFGIYERLRREAPVHHFPGTRHYAVTRYGDVQHVLRNPAIFSSARALNEPADPDLAAVAAAMPPVTAGVIDSDPPFHTVSRDVGRRPLVPGRLRGWEEAIREIAGRTIDAFASRGEVEFVEEFCRLQTIRVICHVFGVPLAQRDALLEWSTQFREYSSGLVAKARMVECLQGLVEMTMYFTDLLEARRADPGDDYISILVQTPGPDGEPLPTPRLVSIIRNVFGGGHETTSFMLAETMRLLLENPDQLAKVAADRSLIGVMLEEALRLESPNQWMPRIVLEDTEVAGVPIPAGSTVLVLWASANRDDEVFENPARFDIERPNVRRHLAFGTGIHTCLGAPLARLQGRIAFEVLFERLTDFALAEKGAEVRLVADPRFRPIRHLHLRFREIATGADR